MMKSYLSSHSRNSLRPLMALVLLIAAPLLHAQQNFTSTGGVTSTPESVGIGVTAPLQGKLHVFSATDNTVLALYSRTSLTNAVKFEDVSVLDPGSQYGVVADFQGNGAIKMGSLRLGFQGYPYIMSLGDGQALQFNSVGVLGFTPGDVVVGGIGLGNGLRVNGSGNSSFVGDVGIGTTSPLRPLSFANTIGEKLSLHSSSSTPHDYYGFGIAGAELQYQVVAGAHHSFYVGTTEAVKIDAAGNMNVVGTITGAVIRANYQDLAEWVPATMEMPSGTVVVVGEDGDNTVTSSMRAYDTSVAGVVSANPGLLLGVASASKAKIATTGRVRVRVDATKSPIRKGDLLVTSDRPGMAMKSEPLDLAGVKLHRPGTLIGKALEPLAGGEGEIVVLLSLQ
jgi:hypothetical protein